MSVSINWNAFAHQEAFQSQIRQTLTQVLNKQKPKILEDTIEVRHLDWGTKAPTLEILEIGDLASDKFRGVFKLSYDGGASITLATKVQANLLNVYENSSVSRFVTPRIVGASASLPIPLHLTLRNINLQGTVIVAFSKTNGLTLVFRNDPLHSIEVKSTFDQLPGIATFLQQQIESQIRGLFREEVPSALYQLSLKYMSRLSAKDALNIASTEPEVEPILFADIDKEKPVSLVNILQIESLFSGRQTLALSTPVLRNTTLRSNIMNFYASPGLQGSTLKLLPNCGSVYTDIYNKAKQARNKGNNKKTHRRRVICLKNKKNTQDASEEYESRSTLKASSENTCKSPISSENAFAMNNVIGVSNTEEDVLDRAAGHLNGSYVPEVIGSSAATTLVSSPIDSDASSISTEQEDDEDLILGQSKDCSPFIYSTDYLFEQKMRNTLNGIPKQFQIGLQNNIYVPMIKPLDEWKLRSNENDNDLPPAYVA